MDKESNLINEKMNQCSDMKQGHLRMPLFAFDIGLIIFREGLRYPPQFRFG